MLDTFDAVLNLSEAADATEESGSQYGLLAPPPLSSTFFELRPFPLLGLFAFCEASQKGALGAASLAFAALDGVVDTPNAKREPMYNASPARFKDGAAQPPSVLRAAPGALFSIGALQEEPTEQRQFETTTRIQTRPLARREKKSRGVPSLTDAAQGGRSR